MRTYFLMITCGLLMAVSCSAAYCYTLTFDDIPSGTRVEAIYMDTYRVRFDSYFRAINPNYTAYYWEPYSGSNVLAWTGSDTPLGGRILFGYYTPHDAQNDDIYSVGAYFSTDVGVMIRISAYRKSGPSAVLVGSVVIGSPGESWENSYVEISFAGDSFYSLDFEGVNSHDELLRFCLDDLTVTPVPEPASLLALGIGVTAMLVRRRR